MRTRIFWNHQTGERYELSEDQIAERRNRQDGPTVLPDIDRVYGGGFTSPIDGSHITSRSQLRRHNATHQVRQGGDWKPGELIAKENARVAERRAKGGHFEWK
jgi:hypothetical protein